MQIAVAGGTGLAGRHTVAALQRNGHQPVVISRSAGVDLITGDGLDAVLAGVHAVIDVTNAPAGDAAAARQFFGTATTNLLAAEQHGGVGHHVVLSIVGIDRVEGNAHYAGKRYQEELVGGGPIPFTIVRATQFHEFAAMVVGWTRRDETAMIAPLLVQPVAAADVGDVLAEVACGPPLNGTLELAGPETQDLVDMARRTMTARGEDVKLIPSWQQPFGVEMAGEVLLPGAAARLAPTTFDTWLTTQGTARS
jgi:uncharacterized protein YbjT (DUF2867 family)